MHCLFLLTVMLNLFQHLATVEFHGYAKRLPQGRNMGQTLKQVQGDVKSNAGFPALPVFYPSYRSSFATICGSRRLAGGHSPLLHTGCPLTLAGIQCIRADFVCPQGNNARRTHTSTLRDDVKACWTG